MSVGHEIRNNEGKIGPPLPSRLFTPLKGVCECRTFTSRFEVEILKKLVLVDRNKQRTKTKN